MTPKPLIYIYTYGDCTELFLNIKKNADFYKDCRGFLIKKNALLEPKINFLTTFSMGLTSKPLMTVIWTLKTLFWAKIDQKWSKNSKKMIKKPFFDPIFQFSWVPPLENAKNRFSNMKSPLKMAKTSRSFGDFLVFFIFWPQNHGFDHFWPQKPKNPEEILPPPSFWCHNPAPTTTLCLAMLWIVGLCFAAEMATSFSTKTNMKST